VETFLESVLDDIATLGGGWLLLAAFLLAFGETAFLADLFVPGEVGLVVVGAAAARGGDSLVAMIAAAAAGATLGDSVGWLLGRYGATRLVERWAWTRRRVAPKVDQARGYFERRGGGAVFVGRFVGAVRAVVSVVAGMSGMPYWRFLGWNVLASLAWTGLVVSAGYFLGRHADSIVAEIALLVAIAVGAFAALWWLVRRFARRSGSPSGRDADDR
jgi:membrane-associated protein